MVWLAIACVWLASWVGCGGRGAPQSSNASSSISISAVTATSVSPNSATIAWTTDLPASSRVEYGTSTAYGSSTTVDSSQSTSHSQVLTGLTASTTYHYRVHSGAAISGDYSFATTGSAAVVPANAGLTISDLTGATQTNRPISVPRFFRQADIPQYAQAVINGAPVLTQCDVKNRWPDGSLKFAIISFVVPALSSSGTPVSFQNQATGNNAGYLAAADMLNAAYDFEAGMQLSGTANRTISARAMVQAGQFRYWLQGQVVTAVIIEDRASRSYDVNTDGGTGNPLHPIFEAWFYPQSHKVEVGFTLENSWASSTSTSSARDQTFALTLTTGYAAPLTRLTQPTFTQNVFTRWRRSFWIGGDPGALKYDWNAPYLLQTKAYPNWDTQFTPDENALASEYKNYMNLAATYPARMTIPGYDDGGTNGGIVMIDQATDAGGAAEWIGPAHTADIMYLLSGDNRMRQMMLDTADLNGRFPIWFREADHNAGTGKYFDHVGTGSVDTYGRVISINARQQLRMVPDSLQTPCPGNGSDLVNLNAPVNVGGWNAHMDTSHFPEWGYMAYTLTGKYYYLEQLQMSAAYALGYYPPCASASDPSQRQGKLGLIIGASRYLAWGLRQVGFAAFATPDGDPEAAYFRDKLLNNVAMLEGEHGITARQATGTADRDAAYTFGRNTSMYSEVSTTLGGPGTVSPLGAWRADDCVPASSWSTQGCYATSDNNMNTAVAAGAEAQFMEGYLAIELGMFQQMGFVDTTQLLSFPARRYLHVLLDPTVNHYLIQEYVYPTRLARGSRGWVGDWATYQQAYANPASSWTPGAGDSALIVMSALSYMTKQNVDGYSGQTAWNWYRSNRPVPEFSANPKWSIRPLY